MIEFYTRDQAAAAIAAELHPDDKAMRLDVCEIYRNLIYDALCAGGLIGRYPDTRIQIDRNRPGSTIAFNGCMIRERDLNAWLDGVGNGVQIDGKHREQLNVGIGARPDGSLPDTAKLAEDLGPFLSGGKDAAWLKKTLGDLRGRPELKRYRVLTSRPRGSAWRAAGVVIWLIKNGHMSQKSVKAALKDNYPDDYDMMDR
ncbi:hypothetical protein [Paraburkholderia lacunae]|uniref:Uncharacterized protein n=1 Tax=Paraburkholderia lacunae TaxID=2211104 RepID=A0A370N7R6_9BURK|nr:hypothetical protein [Paraburkholderia lacunae]RDK01622.1 hypothetical protein DLM46_17630 [Paraburkholderia lacunae]